jgi:Tol biopolymer transport system component
VNPPKSAECMKRCPECRRDYYDDTLLFCLDDGNALLDGPASGKSDSPASAVSEFGDEPRTAILHETAPLADDDTQAQLTSTNPTAVLPSADMRASRRSKISLITAAVVILLAIGGTAWYLIPRKPVRPGLDMDVTKLISGLKGTPGDVSISPDGKYVAYSLFEEGKAGLWLRQISQDASIPIVPAVEGVGFNGISFSPDSELIYFSAYFPAHKFTSIYSVPIVGGKEPKKIKEKVIASIDFSLSPDGSEVVFPRYVAETGEYAAFVARTDGSGEEQKILSRSGNDWFDSIACSPDGKYIAAAFGTATGGYSTSMALVPSHGGDPMPLGEHKFGANVKSLTWLRDGTGLVATTAMSNGAKLAIWHISYPSGAAERITKDVNAYFAVDVTADGKTAVMAYSDFDASVWVTSPDGAARKIATGSDDGRGGVVYSNDGRIIYIKSENDEDNLWIMNADGSAAKPLTAGNTGANISPSFASPDGKIIVFTSTRPDNVQHVWRVNVDGTELKQLITTESSNATLSRDGKWIVYAEPARSNRLMKIPTAGGEPSPLSNDRLVSDAAGFSEDGKLVSCATFDNGKWRTALIELETGKLARFVDMPPAAGTACFSRHGTEYIYSQVDQGVANLWTKPVAGGAARQLTKFTDGFMRLFADAPDGKSYVVTRSEGTNEIVIAKNFR